MLTLSSFPKSLLPLVRVSMQEGREKYTSTAMPFVTEVDSTLPIESYVMYGQHRGPQLFTGEVRYSKLSEYSQTIKNLEYYDAVGIDWELIKYSQTPRIAEKVRNFGFEWERGKDKMRAQMLSNGATNVGYDGTPFFGASHVDGDSGVQSNIFTGASLFSAVTYQLHAQAMATFKDDRGEVMGKKPTHVIVSTGSANAIEAKKLANSTFYPGTVAAINPFAGSFEVIETPYLGASVQFIVADLSGLNKPIIWQNAGPEIFTSQERDSEWFQDHKQYKYAQHQDWGIGYNDWRLATMQI